MIGFWPVNTSLHTQNGSTRRQTRRYDWFSIDSESRAMNEVGGKIVTSDFSWSIASIKSRLQKNTRPSSTNSSSRLLELSYSTSSPSIPRYSSDTLQERVKITSNPMHGSRSRRGGPGWHNPGAQFAQTNITPPIVSLEWRIPQKAIWSIQGRVLDIVDLCGFQKAELTLLVLEKLQCSSEGSRVLHQNWFAEYSRYRMVSTSSKMRRLLTMEIWRFVQLRINRQFTLWKRLMHALDTTSSLSVFLVRLVIYTEDCWYIQSLIVFQDESSIIWASEVALVHKLSSREVSRGRSIIRLWRIGKYNLSKRGKGKYIRGRFGALADVGQCLGN